MNKVWIVKQQIPDSYEGWTDNYETVSIHKTEAGANLAAEECRKGMSLSTITGGNYDSFDKADPDDVLGTVEDVFGEELMEDLRQEAAKPGATLEGAVLVIIERHGMEPGDVIVTSFPLRD